jgi:hypothetical protein
VGYVLEAAVAAPEIETAVRVVEFWVVMQDLFNQRYRECRGDSAYEHYGQYHMLRYDMS